MAHLLVVFGITGQQGGSVARKVLEDPELSKTYKIRGVCRNASKPEAQAFVQQGVEVVEGNIDDRASLGKILQGAHTVYAMTASIYTATGVQEELAQGKAVADESVAAGVKFLIYSTVPSPKKISNGKYPVGSFDVKDAVKEYIESLPIKSAFFAPGSFMQNFHTHMGPQPGPGGNLAFTSFVKPTTQFPLIDIAGDTGKFVAPILADPAKYAGKTVCSATRLYTMTEMADIMSESSGKKVIYNQVPKEVYAGFLPEAMRADLVNMLSYFEEFGYYGSTTKEAVQDAVKSARGSPVEFEAYLKREPLKV